VNPVLHILRQLGGLFFDDASLAAAVLFILAVTVILSRTAWFDADPRATMAFMVGGVVAALVDNVVRAARAARSGQ
jgi:hypothetical protein